MPRTRRDRSYETLLVDSVVDQIESESDRIAAENGPPPGKRMSEAEETRLWGLRDPNVQYEATLTTLLTQGFGETAEQLVIVQENPELLDAYANPAPTPEVAEALAALAEYPFRISLWNHLGDPQDRVAVANRVARNWAKTQPALPEAPVEPEAAPAPMPTNPALPAQPAAAMGQPPMMPAAPAAYPPEMGG